LTVVDTSVWIAVLNDVPAPQAQRCVELIEGGEPVAITDVILTEILQGLRSEQEARLVERHLRSFPICVGKALTNSEGGDHFGAEEDRDRRRGGGERSSACA